MTQGFTDLDDSEESSSRQSASQTDDVLDNHGIDKGTQQGAQGVNAQRKANLAKMDAPLSLLDQLGIDVPHRTFDPENAREYPTTVTIEGPEDIVRVHLHQDVREIPDDTFGSFGSHDFDEDDVIWTVVDLTDETVTLTVVGDWSKRRSVPFDEFAEGYEPLTLTNGAPRFGY